MALFLFVIRHLSQIEQRTRRLTLAVGISLPFLLVRIIYSLLYTVGENPRFSPIIGDVKMLLFMNVLEEFVIVIVCLTAAFSKRRDTKPDFER